MGRRIIKVLPKFIQSIATIGHQVGDKSSVRTVAGLPSDVRFIRAWIEHDHPDSYIVLLFESSQWSESDPGAFFPAIEVRFEERILNNYDENHPLDGHIWMNKC